MALPVNKHFIHHCQAMTDGADDTHGGVNSSYQNCRTNPGHEKFIPVSEFSMKHLPLSCQSEYTVSLVQNRIDRTVKVVVFYTSPKRPETYPDSAVRYPFSAYRGTSEGKRCGTGYLDSGYSERTEQASFKGPCPCPECMMSDEPKMAFWEFEVSSATHVVYDKSEAESAIVELFYDSENRDSVKYLYAVDVLGRDRHRHRTDHCKMVCVTHDPLLAATLYGILSSYEDPVPADVPCGMLISHPHGVSKRISFGNVHHECRVPIKPGMSVRIRKGCRYRFPAKTGQEKGEPSQNSGKKIVQVPGVSKPMESISLGARNSSLPFKLTAIIPPTATFQCREKFMPDPRKRWVTFHHDTRFVTQYGADVHVPANTKFSRSVVYGHVLGPSYITYDMATCPGSSGAQIIDLGSGDQFVFPYIHLGCGEGDNNNHSGLDRWYLVDYSVDYDDDYDGDDTAADDDEDDEDDDVQLLVEKKKEGREEKREERKKESKSMKRRRKKKEMEKAATLPRFY